MRKLGVTFTCDRLAIAQFEPLAFAIFHELLLEPSTYPLGGLQCHFLCIRRLSGKYYMDSNFIKFPLLKYGIFRFVLHVDGPNGMRRILSDFFQSLIHLGQSHV